MMAQTVPDATMTGRQLRLLLNDYVLDFSVTVEESADQIIASATDISTDRNALLWKINGISAVFTAASREDALATYFDLAILCEQMLNYFETGAGKDLFGVYQPIAVLAARNARERLRSMARSATRSEESFQDGEEFVREFASKHPLENIYFSRPSIVPAYVERMKNQKKSIFDITGTVSEALDDLNALLAMYAEYIPKQARWQAELMLMEIPERDLLPEFSRNFATVSGSTDRLASVAEEVPLIIERERERVVEDLRGERIAVLDETNTMLNTALAKIESERVAVLEAVRSERGAVLEAIEKERLAVLAAVTAEREAAITQAVEQLREERLAATKDIASIAEDKVNLAAQQAERLIDHAIWRVFQLLSLFLVVALVLLLLYLLLGRRLRASAG